MNFGRSIKATNTESTDNILILMRNSPSKHSGWGILSMEIITALTRSYSISNPQGNGDYALARRSFGFGFASAYCSYIQLIECVGIAVICCIVPVKLTFLLQIPFDNPAGESSAQNAPRVFHSRHQVNRRKYHSQRDIP